MNNQITSMREEKAVIGEESGYYGAPFLFYLNNFFLILATVTSLTLLYPIAYYLSEKRKIDNTFVDGKKLSFDGKLSEAYAIYFLGLFLAAISIAVINALIFLLFPALSTKFVNYALSAAAAGINALFVTNRLLRWKKKNIHYDGSNSGESYMGRNLIKCTVVSLASSILGILTLGISYPLVYKLKQSYYTDMSVIDGDDVVLHGKTTSLYGQWLLGLLFVVITFGLFIPLLNYYLYRWSSANTHIRKKTL